MYVVSTIDYDRFLLVGEGTVFTRLFCPRYCRTFSSLASSIIGCRCFLLVTVTGGWFPPIRFLCSVSIMLSHVVLTYSPFFGVCTLGGIPG